MVISKHDIIKRVQESSGKDWEILEQGNRVIISHAYFRCFIGRAFDMKTQTSTVSAHMLLYDNTSELSRLQFWEASNHDDDEKVLERILKELNNLELYYKFHNPL